MRKILVTLLISIGFSFTHTNMENTELSHVRDIFHKPVSKKNIEEIINLPSDKYFSSTIKAYQAVSKTMMAKYVTSPFSKLGYFNEGKKELETIIASDQNLETVYLRLLIQLNVPSLLNYYSKIETDLDYFCVNFANSPIDQNTKELFKETLLKTEKIGEYSERKIKLQHL